MADTISFMREFKKQVKGMQGVVNIEFFGSVLDPNRFRPGKSDVDVIIQGKLSKLTKDSIRLILQGLSDKYGIQVEKATYLHPVPIYLQDVVAEKVFDTLIRKRHVPSYFEEFRKAEKAAARLTLGERWAGKEHPSAIIRLIELIWS